MKLSACICNVVNLETKMSEIKLIQRKATGRGDRITVGE